MRVSITSTTNAKFNQRFTVQRRLETDPEHKWYSMGTKSSYVGAQKQPIAFLPDTQKTIWRIIGQNDGGDGDAGWKTSRGIDPAGIGTQQITVRFDDDFSGDTDFNDQVITIRLIYPNDSKPGENFYIAFDEAASGPAGEAVYDKDTFNDPDPGKGKQKP